MGCDKAEIEFESVTLLERAVRRVQPLADRVLVIGRHVDAGRLPSIEGHLDAYPPAGPLGGIATALGLSHPHACLIVPCDMPNLREGLLRDLIRLHGSDVDCTLAVNPVTGRREPLVAIYEARCLSVMAQAIAAGRLAIWRTLDRLAVRRLTVSAGEADQFINLNTPGDLSRLRS